MLVSVCGVCSGVEGLGIQCGGHGYGLGVSPHPGPGENCERPVPSTVCLGIRLGIPYSVM